MNIDGKTLLSLITSTSPHRFELSTQDNSRHLVLPYYGNNWPASGCEHQRLVDILDEFSLLDVDYNTTVCKVRVKDLHDFTRFENIAMKFSALSAHCPQTTLGVWLLSGAIAGCFVDAGQMLRTLRRKSYPIFQGHLLELDYVDNTQSLWINRTLQPGEALRDFNNIWVPLRLKMETPFYRLRVVFGMSTHGVSGFCLVGQLDQDYPWFIITDTPTGPASLTSHIKRYGQRRLRLKNTHKPLL